MKKVFKRLCVFFRKDLWKINTDDLSGIKRFFIDSLKVLITSFKYFISKKTTLKASSLTYFTALSVVPIIAFAFGISKGFGLESVLENLLRESLSGQQEVLDYVINFSNTLLSSTKGGLVAISSLVFLLYLIIRLIKKVDDVFNEIWGVELNRKAIRRLADYWGIIFVASVILLASSSITVFMNTFVKSVSHKFHFLTYISPALIFLIKLVPYILLSSLFILILYFLPNTKVKFKSALVAGIVAGIFYQLTMNFYITFQVGMSRYSAIYGSFAALPLFLMWVQLSWIIVLFSVQVSYVHQNIHLIGANIISEISNNQRYWITVLVLNQILTTYKTKHDYILIEDIADKIDIPESLVLDIVDMLQNVGLLVKVDTLDVKTLAYVPIAPIEEFKIKTIIDKIDNYKFSKELLPVVKGLTYNKFVKSLKDDAFLDTAILDVKF